MEFEEFYIPTDEEKLMSTIDNVRALTCIINDLQEEMQKAARLLKDLKRRQKQWPKRGVR